MRPEKGVEGVRGVAPHASTHHEGTDSVTTSGIGAAPVNHGHLKNNYIATAAPGGTDDVNGGYSIGSIWVDITANKSYICLDITTDAAVWRPISHATTAVDDVSSPPTDAELDTAFGQPGTLGDGFIGILDDNDAGTTVWLCVAMNSLWWYEQLTKAV